MKHRIQLKGFYWQSMGTIGMTLGLGLLLGSCGQSPSFHEIRDTNPSSKKGSEESSDRLLTDGQGTANSDNSNQDNSNQDTHEENPYPGHNNDSVAAAPNLPGNAAPHPSTPPSGNDPNQEPGSDGDNNGPGQPGITNPNPNDPESPGLPTIPEPRVGYDSFLQNGSDSGDGKLDLLLVVDNSRSMLDEQQKLANLSPLLSFIDRSDWRLAVTTTDLGEKTPRLVLEKQDSTRSLQQKIETFNTTVRNIGTDGSGDEHGIGMSLRGLGMTLPRTTTPWRRQGATFATLLVSDEDNCSDGISCPYKPEHLYQALLNLQRSGSIKSARFYAIVSRFEGECPTTVYPGLQYLRAVELIGGISGSICGESYDDVLADISADLSVELEVAFSLKNEPIPGSVRITVEGQEYTHGFKLSGQTVLLNVAPAAGAKIEIYYEY
jgi:hypothetical protein